MELYYNPEQMPAAEIKQTFVGREVMLKELLALARRQPQGAGVQHVLLIGARGMGKTTMMLMLRFAVLERDLPKRRGEAATWRTRRAIRNWPRAATLSGANSGLPSIWPVRRWPL